MPPWSSGGKARRPLVGGPGAALRPRPRLLYTGGMDLIDAAVLGVVEGLTEFVPVSSTGHLILASALMGLDATPAQKAAVDAFDIVIQAGAWLACVLYYLRYLLARARDLISAEPTERARGRRLVVNLLIAFVPVVIVGLPLRAHIKAWLFGAAPVAVALAIGGLVMIVADRRLSREGGTAQVDDISPKQALIVGLFQCFSLIPGTSRSMSTIIGGLACGLRPRVAADFSFLLAVPVLGAATAYELLKEYAVMTAHIGPAAMAVGMGVSFVVGWASIAGFIRLLSLKGLAPFGVYRMVAAVAVWLVLV